MLTDKDKELWDSLTDEQKWENHVLLNKIMEHNANVLHQVCDHLLGKDWYVVHGDWESVPNEILRQIKRDYPDINYSKENTIKKIKEAIKDYFKHKK